MLDVLLTLDRSHPGGQIINRAEILSFDDDGNPNTTLNRPDVDSTPDGSNFSQTGETDDLDDDNKTNEDGLSGGDEDDHDPAGITVQVMSMDLALTKVIASR